MTLPAPVNEVEYVKFAKVIATSLWSPAVQTLIADFHKNCKAAAEYVDVIDRETYEVRGGKMNEPKKNLVKIIAQLKELGNEVFASIKKTDPLQVLQQIDLENMHYLPCVEVPVLLESYKASLLTDLRSFMQEDI